MSLPTGKEKLAAWSKVDSQHMVGKRVCLETGEEDLRKQKEPAKNAGKPVCII